MVARHQVGAAAVVWWLTSDEPVAEEAQEIDPDEPVVGTKRLDSTAAT
jgi:hypothetical protein